MKLRLNKKYLFTLLVILILLFGITLTNINKSNSRYVSGASGSKSSKIATWKININGELSSSLQMNLEDTITYNNYSDEKIIPGSEGIIPITIDTTDTKVAVNYKITLDAENTTIPSNLKLYTDESLSTEFSSITNNILPSQNGIHTINIYWKWLYTTEDESDTWQNETMKVTLNIVAKQRLNGDT